MDPSPELSRLLETGAFTEAELSAARARCDTERGVGERDAPGVSTGFVVVWSTGTSRNRGFFLGIDGKQFRIPRSLFHALREGAAYRVYFSGSDFVAIEPVAAGSCADAVSEAARDAGFSRDDPRAMTDSGVTDRLRRELMAGFVRAGAFTAEDLEQCRLGKLTANTRAKLRRDATSLYVLGGMMVVFAGLFVLFSRERTTFLYVASGLVALLGAWLLKNGVAHTIGIARGRVLSSLGTTDAKEAGKHFTEYVWCRTGTRNTLRLERRVFAMHGFHPSALYALQYELYHLPDTQLALSFEPGEDLSPLFQARPEPLYPPL